MDDEYIMPPRCFLSIWMLGDIVMVCLCFFSDSFQNHSAAKFFSVKSQ